METDDEQAGGPGGIAIWRHVPFDRDPSLVPPLDAGHAANRSKAVWATNWGQNVGQERTWLMEAALPAVWMDSFDAQSGN